MTDTNILDLTLLSTNQTDRSTTVNTMLQAIEVATQKALAVDLTSGDVALTESQYTRNFNFVCDGHGVSTRNLTVPLTINAVALVGRFYMVQNLGTGTVTVKGATGATADVAGGLSALIFNDGTDQILVSENSGGSSTLAGLTDVSLSGLADLNHLVYDATYAVWVNEVIPFILSVYIPQVAIDNELILSYVFDRTVRFTSALPGSQAYANTVPGGDDQWLIRKNGSNIGTVNFTGSSSTVTFTFSSTQTFVAGDRLELVADYPSDDTLAGVTLTLRGTRLT